MDYWVDYKIFYKELYKMIADGYGFDEALKILIEKYGNKQDRYNYE